MQNVHSIYFIQIKITDFLTTYSLINEDNALQTTNKHTHTKKRKLLLETLSS